MVEMDVDGYLARIACVKQEIEGWIEERRREMQDQKRAYAIEMQQNEKDLQQAQQAKARLEQEQQSHSRHISDAEREARAAKIEFDLLEQEKQKKEPLVQQLLHRNQIEHTKIQSLENDAEKEKEQQKLQLEELKKELQMYQRLGLHFLHDREDKMNIRFTLIDKKDPQREFSCRVGIHPSNDQFLVDNCEPPLMSLEALVHALNESGDLSSFIRSLRREFKNLIG